MPRPIVGLNPMPIVPSDPSAFSSRKSWRARGPALGHQIRAFPYINSISLVVFIRNKPKDIAGITAGSGAAVFHRQNRVFREVDRNRESINPQALRVGIRDHKPRLRLVASTP